MPYRLRYQVNIDWVGTGLGPMSGALAVIPGAEGGGSQTYEVLQQAGGQNIVGTGTGGALAAADITTLTQAMQTDVAAKLNTNIAIPQGWATGNP